MASGKRAYGLTTPFVDIFPEPITKTSAPTATEKNYENGQVWIYKNGDTRTQYTFGGLDSSGDAVWILAGPGASEVDTLTGDTGGPIAPAAGNIDILGGDGITVAGTAGTLTINRDSEGGYPITPYVVGAAGEAGYQTIQAAITDATAAGGTNVIWVQPGTYTEDLTIDSSITFMSIDGVATIVGQHTPPATGAVTFDGFVLVSATNVLNSAAAGSTTFNINNSFIVITNGYVFNLPNWTGEILMDNCGEASTNDGVINNATGSSDVKLINVEIGNGTGNTMQLNGGGGFLRFDTCNVNCPVNMVGSGDLLMQNGVRFGETTTIGGSLTGYAIQTAWRTGASQAITFNSSGNFSISSGEIQSTNVPAIGGTGAGTLTLTGISFPNDASIAATITVGSAGTTSSGIFETLAQDSGLQISGNDIDADGSDANIDIVMTPKGTGNVVIDSGGLEAGAGIDLDFVCAAGQGSVLTLGDSAGATDFIVEALDGTDIFTVNSAGTISFSGLTVTGAFAQTGGTFNVGQDNAANAVNIGGGTTARAIAIGNSTGAHTIAIGNASAGAITVDTAAGFSVDAALQLNIDSSQAAADAIVINTSNAAGGIDCDSGTGGTAIDSTGAISLDAAAASNFTVGGAGIDLTLASTGGRVIVDGEEAAADAVRIISSAGGLDVDVALQMNLTSTQAAADAILIDAANAAGGIDCDSGTGGTTIDSTGAISLDAAATSNFTVGGAGVDLDLVSTGGRVVVNGEEAAADALRIISSAGGLDADVALKMHLTSTQNAADAIEIEAAAGGIDITAAGAAGEDIDITCTAGSVNITAGESAADAIVVNASGAAGAIQLNSGTGGVVMDSGQTVNVTAVATAASPYAVLGSDYVIATTTSAGVLTLTLPAAPATGRKIIVVDESGNAAANNVTISGNGKNIAAGGTTSATKLIDSNYGTMTLVYTGTIWNAMDVA